MQLLSKILFGFLSVLLIVAIFGFMSVLTQIWREHQMLEEKEQLLAKQLADQNVVLKTKQEYVRKAVHEPEFLERIVRDRLSYVKSGESVYRFE